MKYRLSVGWPSIVCPVCEGEGLLPYGRWSAPSEAGPGGYETRYCDQCDGTGERQPTHYRLIKRSVGHPDPTVLWNPEEPQTLLRVTIHKTTN